MPMEGSYLITRSMCSRIPKPTLPVLEKLSFLNSYSLTLRPRSRISSALAPRTVQWTAIFFTADTKRANSVSGFREDRLLASELFQDLGGSCQSVSGFADTDVQAQFADPKITHNVLRLVTFDYVRHDGHNYSKRPH